MTKHHAYITLFSIIIVSSLALTVAVYLLTSGVINQQNTQLHQASVQARALADACIEKNIQTLIDSPAYTGTNSLSLATGNCDATVSDIGSNKSIESTGITGNVKKKIKVIISQVSPNVIIDSWEEVANF